MKTAERILGFASCALGLLPLLSDAARAQQVAPIACQAISTLTGVGPNSNGPMVVAPNAGSHIEVCGYSIQSLGIGNTSFAFMVYGYGSTCASSNGITATQFTPNVSSPNIVQRNGLAYLIPVGASICVQSNGSSTAGSAEINYSIQ